MNVSSRTARELLDIRPQQLAAHHKLVQETYAMLGPPHYDRYEFLLAVSEHFGEIGLEHHRSSENRRPPNYLTEWDKGDAGRDLLPHEFTHSWNGKFRRPAGLATPDFNVPMRDSLLWVYEGLTNYFGAVLATRSRLWSEDFAPPGVGLASPPTWMRNRAGRAWRNLEDTTDQPLITPRRPLSWLSWQRTEDYYTEGERSCGSMWIRGFARLTGDKRSLDDFTHAFFGGARDGTGSQHPVTYTLARSHTCSALKSVAPFDWEKLSERAAAQRMVRARRSTGSRVGAGSWCTPRWSPIICAVWRISTEPSISTTHWDSPFPP